MNPAPSQLVNCTDLVDCFQKIYNLFFAIFLALAFLYFLYGAFEYLLSGASITRKEVGKSKMVNSIVALIIVLIMPVIINIINPEIFKGAKIKFPVLEVELTEILLTEEEVEQGIEPVSEVPLPAGVITGRLLTPQRPGNLVRIPRMQGLIIAASNPYLADIVIPHLQAAVYEAQKKGYQLKITSAYRDIQKQRQLWENKKEEFRRAHPNWTEKEIEKAVRKWVAPPGRSPHHSGGAIDVALINPRTGKSSFSKDAEGIKLRKELQIIMNTAGWTRYAREHWHFEIYTTRWYRAPGRVSY